MKKFAITGVAGYIAPRHLQAIKDTGNILIAAVDPHDSVGILDKYFPETSFFTEIERFDRHLEKLHKNDPANKIDYLSVCSPNHLHESHIRMALRLGAVAICEKPLVLKPSNLDLLEELERELNGKIYNVLQLRLQPSIIQLKNQIEKEKTGKKYNINLSYITSRGPWYKYSWKGAPEKSGGIASNIGIHFFDMLIWIFGSVQENKVYLLNENKASGFLELENANVNWFLSIDRNDLPKEIADKNQFTFRSITYNETEIEFTNLFTDLHTLVYQDILNGGGFGIGDARPSIELVNKIRFANINKPVDEPHPLYYMNKK